MPLSTVVGLLQSQFQNLEKFLDRPVYATNRSNAMMNVIAMFVRMDVDDNSGGGNRASVTDFVKFFRVGSGICGYYVQLPERKSTN
jgi:hypothetical protein